jgi:5-methylcytosine-specific restriction endonuclease McrA
MSYKDKENEQEYRKVYYEANKEKIKAYREANKEKIKESRKAYREANKEKLKDINKAYREANKENLKEYQKVYYEANKENILHRNKVYYKANKENVLDRKKVYERKRRKTDPMFRLTKNMRNHVSRYLTEGKQKRTSEIVGCSWKFLRLYFERQFRDGMSWDNYGEYWEIDHIIPLSSAKSDSELYELNHYTNLQPLTKEENRLKSDNLEL